MTAMVAFRLHSDVRTMFRATASNSYYENQKIEISELQNKKMISFAKFRQKNREVGSLIRFINLILVS